MLEDMIIFLANTVGEHWYFGALLGCLSWVRPRAQRIETRRQRRHALRDRIQHALVVLAGITFSLGDPLSGVVPSSVRPVYGYVVWYFPIVLFSAMPSPSHTRSSHGGFLASASSYEKGSSTSWYPGAPFSSVGSSCSGWSTRS